MITVPKKTPWTSTLASINVLYETGQSFNYARDLGSLGYWARECKSIRDASFAALSLGDSRGAALTGVQSHRHAFSYGPFALACSTRVETVSKT